MRSRLHLLPVSRSVCPPEQPLLITETTARQTYLLYSLTMPRTATELHNRFPQQGLPQLSQQPA